MRNPPEYRIVIYRVLQEAMNNIALTVMLDRVPVVWQAKRDARIHRCDNGVGFDPRKRARRQVRTGNSPDA